MDLIQNPIFIISIIFWIIAFTLVKVLGKKKEYITLFFPFLVLFRVKFLNKLFKKIASKNRRLWRIWWNIGIVVSFLFMMIALYFFISNLIQLIIDPKPENAILPLIPGVTISLPQFSALIFPILITITVHEFSHAIAAEIDGVDAKSAGIFGGGLFFIIGFGAFVEVDEFQLYSKNYSNMTRLRVASAGVWTNIIMAGIVFLLLNASVFPWMMSLSYESNTFRVSGVVPSLEGGFNENNIEVGDIVYQINGTIVDSNKGSDLSDILANKTEIQCSPGDYLNLTCIDPKTDDMYNREIILGYRSFIGFEIIPYNNTAFKVGEVYSATIGGNNEGLVTQETIITKFDNIQLNYYLNQTLEQYLTLKEPNYILNLTTDQNVVIQVNVNYFPNAPGAHVLYNIFTGLNFEKINDYSINITQVFKNETESGINEANIFENIVITQINHVPINLTGTTIKEWVRTVIQPNPGDILVFADQNNNEYFINTTTIPIIPVYIGLTSESYWLAGNWLGKLLGSNFPNSFYVFLMYTWMISFSLALFNLLPSAIFDGGRMIKEIIDKLVGNKKIDKNAKKSLHYEFNTKNSKQHLMTHGIYKISAVKELIPKPTIDNVEIPKEEIYSIRELEYQALDTSKDGFYDTVEILSGETIINKTMIEVDIEYEHDLQENLKKKIYKYISWPVGLIVLASFIISLVKFDNTFFWL